MATPAASLLAESIAVFTNAAHQALSQVQSQAQHITQASADAHEARTERDAALDAARLLEQKLEREVGNSKAALKQAEVSILHQKETISQLRREASQLRQEAAQWKVQSQVWQDHFLRVEQERCRLHLKIEELATERSHAIVDRFTPSRPVTDIPDPFSSSSSSSYTKRFSASPPIKYHDTYRPAITASPLDIDSPSSARKVDLPPSSRHRANKSPTPPSPPRPPPSLHDKSGTQPVQNHQNIPQHPTRRQTTVIRRVQAVIRVKKEHSDVELEESETHRPTKVRSQKRVVHHYSDENDQNYEESDQSDREDDDELMLGPEEPPNEVPNTSPKKRRKFGGSTGRNKSASHRI